MITISLGSINFGVAFCKHMLLCVCLCSVLLGTVLSLQPQRSISLGETKEEKVMHFLTIVN